MLAIVAEVPFPGQLAIAAARARPAGGSVDTGNFARTVEAGLERYRRRAIGKRSERTAVLERRPGDAGLRQPRAREPDALGHVAVQRARIELGPAGGLREFQRRE